MSSQQYPDYPDAKHLNEYERGLVFQDFVVESLFKQYGIIVQIYSSREYQYSRGESVQRVEIKLDARCTETRRLSIEVAEKSRASMSDWTPSGICRDDNTVFYAQGNEECFWLFFKKHLRLIYEKEHPVVTEKHGTIKTFYIPITRADKIGIRISARQRNQDDK